MRYPYAAAIVTAKQQTATSTPTSINPERDFVTNRVLLMASAAGAFFGHGPSVATNNAAAIPTTGYVEIWTHNPGEIYLVGSQTVYVVFEHVAQAVEV